MHFKALESALIDEHKTQNEKNVGKDVGKDVGLASKIMELILHDPEISMADMAKRINVTSRTVEREIRKLRESGRVERIGGRRFGRWRVIE